MITIDQIKELKKSIKEDADLAGLLSGPGCYVFGVKSSRSKRVMPWYVGKAEKQSVLKEATNAAHLQMYNEVLNIYVRGRPALIFLPQVTPTGRPAALAKGSGKKPSVEFMEDWLIAAALKSNPRLINIKKTKMLNKLWVRGLFNPRPGDSNSESKALKASLSL